MKKVVYTVCSANNLAQSKTMADSFCRFNKDYQVIIGLIDKIQGRFDKDYFTPHILIEVEETGIPGFEEMSSRYTIIELNCACKSFFAQFIFQKFQPDILLYMDSDIWVTNSFEEIEEQLAIKDILLTPHFTTPMPDLDKLPRERDLLRSGLYNAGFIAMKNTPITAAFLDWWAKHMQVECFYNFAEGMGVDQNWLNFLPLYFDNIGILDHKGANVAYWNLHERTLSKKENIIFINNQVPLLFLHISGYNLKNKEALSRHQNRFSLNELPVLKELLDQYAMEVIGNGYEIFADMPCLYARKTRKPTGIIAFINRVLRLGGWKLVKS